MISDVLHDAAASIDDYIRRGMYGDPALFEKDPVMSEVVRLKEQMYSLCGVFDIQPDDDEMMKKGLQHYQDTKTCSYEELVKRSTLREAALAREDD